MKPPEPTAPAFGADHASTYAGRHAAQSARFRWPARHDTPLAERVPQDGKVLVLGPVAGWSSRRSPKSIPTGTSMALILQPICWRRRGRPSAPTHPASVCIMAISRMPPTALRWRRVPSDLPFYPTRKPARNAPPDPPPPASGAPFVLAHISFAQSEPERSQWIARHIAFGGGDPQNQAARAAIATKLFVLSPQEEEAMLEEAGFADITLFYAGLSFAAGRATPDSTEHAARPRK